MTLLSLLCSMMQTRCRRNCGSLNNLACHIIKMQRWFCLLRLQICVIKVQSAHVAFNHLQYKESVVNLLLGFYCSLVPRLLHRSSTIVQALTIELQTWTVGLVQNCGEGIFGHMQIILSLVEPPYALW